MILVSDLEEWLAFSGPSILVSGRGVLPLSYWSKRTFLLPTPIFSQICTSQLNCTCLQWCS